MEKKNVGYYSNPLEDWIMKEETRTKVEVLAQHRLTAKEIEILELRYGFSGEAYTIKKTAEILKIRYETVRTREKVALEKLRNIMLAVSMKEIVDSNIGMTEADLYKIARDITISFIGRYGLVDRDKYRGFLTQSIKDIILWRLSSEERKILLFCSGKYSLFPKLKRIDLNAEFEEIREKIIQLVLEDSFICNKAKMKVKYNYNQH